MLNVFLAYSNVDVVSICDVYQDRLEEISKVILEKRKHEPKKYLNFDEMLANNWVDDIYVS